MTRNPRPEPAQSVQLVEAYVLDRMNETQELIAQRAYEIYERRGGVHGSDVDDWFLAEGQILPELEVEFHTTDSAVSFTARVPGFDAGDLEVVVGRQVAAICGIHSSTCPLTAGGLKNKKVMKIIELPFAVDPASGAATFQSETLKVRLPRFR